MSGVQLSEIHDREQSILFSEAANNDTFSGISVYASALGYPSRGMFIEAINGKVVLDIGSGLGGLAKTVAVEGVNAQIISLNPRLLRKDVRVADREYSARCGKAYIQECEKRKTFKQKAVDRIQQVLWWLKPKKYSATETIIRTIQDKHDENAVASFSHNLPLASNTVDLIFDNNAMSKYASPCVSEPGMIVPPLHRYLFTQSIKEMMRVLKPGGEIRISDVMNYGDVDTWREEVLRELGIEYAYIVEDYPFMGTPPPWFDPVCGVIIRKIQ